MAAATQDPPGWSTQVAALGRRVVGPAHRRIVFGEYQGAPRRFTYHADGGVLTIEATDAVAASVGLHTYLRRVCGRAVTWDAHLPFSITTLPDAPPTHGTAETDQAYYLDFCATGHTAAYWGWDDWEREIDWMALHGVTTPLTVVGHEAVLYEAYVRLGLTESQARAFLGGPGYLPWQFMGHLDHFAGPMPSSWIHTHRDLGRRVLGRQRSLGMRPVLPGFIGHVPPALAPGRTRPRGRHGLVTHVLDPTDPLYARICATIVRTQQELWEGTDHLYAIDPFTEMLPVEADPSFPGAVARATLDGLTRADPRAVWVMRTRPFSHQSDFWSTERVSAFLDAIPDERLHLLDLWSEHDPQWSRLEAFGGIPRTWGALLDCGGRSESIAGLQDAVDRLAMAKDTAHPPTGVGLAMEATGNNPAFFELIMDQAWTRTEDVAQDWLPDFVRQRYGTGQNPESPAGRRGLLDTVLGASGVRVAPERFNGVLSLRPHYRDLEDPTRLREQVTGLVWYPWSRLLRAWERLVEAAEAAPALADGPLGHDLADVATAVLARVADHRYLEIVEHLNRHRTVPEQRVARFLEVFDDLDALLDTRPEYRYRGWEAKATSWATSTEDHRVLADNARRVLTVWITLDNLRLDDYAARLWSGLVGDYYRSRWESWGTGLSEALTDPEGAAVRLEYRLNEHSERFLRRGLAYTPPPTESTLVRSRHLLERYAGTESP